MRKSCGGCISFVKFKNDPYSGGICESKDSRVNTDKVCSGWKPIPYERKKENILDTKENK